MKEGKPGGRDKWRIYRFSIWEEAVLCAIKTTVSVAVLSRSTDIFNVFGTERLAGGFLLFRLPMIPTMSNDRDQFTATHNKHNNKSLK